MVLEVKVVSRGSFSSVCEVVDGFGVGVVSKGSDGLMVVALVNGPNQRLNHAVNANDKQLTSGDHQTESLSRELCAKWKEPLITRDSRF